MGPGELRKTIRTRRTAIGVKKVCLDTHGVSSKTTTDGSTFLVWGKYTVKFSDGLIMGSYRWKKLNFSHAEPGAKVYNIRLEETHSRNNQVNNVDNCNTSRTSRLSEKHNFYFAYKAVDIDLKTWGVPGHDGPLEARAWRLAGMYNKAFAEPSSLLLTPNSSTQMMQPFCRHLVGFLGMKIVAASGQRWLNKISLSNFKNKIKSAFINWGKFTVVQCNYIYFVFNV